MKEYSARTLKKLFGGFNESTKKEVAREAVKLVNRREHSDLLRAILLAALMMLDGEIDTHWEDETTPVIEFLW